MKITDETDFMSHIRKSKYVKTYIFYILKESTINKRQRKICLLQKIKFFFKLSQKNFLRLILQDKVFLMIVHYVAGVLRSVKI